MKSFLSNPFFLLSLICAICSGIFIASNAKHKAPKSEYQFNVDSTGYDIMDGNKKIGRVPYGQSTTLDSLIDYNNL